MKENNDNVSELFPKIQNAIDQWLSTKDNTQLIELLLPMKRLWKNWADEEGDYRGGADTYGYDASIDLNMSYISDRWKCAFRLKWIIDGLENGRI
jgi:hypothetical protein